MTSRRVVSPGSDVVRTPMSAEGMILLTDALYKEVEFLSRSTLELRAENNELRVKLQDAKEQQRFMELERAVAPPRSRHGSTSGMDDLLAAARVRAVEETAMQSHAEMTMLHLEVRRKDVVLSLLEVRCKELESQVTSTVDEHLECQGSLARHLAEGLSTEHVLKQRIISAEGAMTLLAREKDSLHRRVECLSRANEDLIVQLEDAHALNDCLSKHPNAVRRASEPSTTPLAPAEAPTHVVEPKPLPSELQPRPLSVVEAETASLLRYAW